MSRYVHNLVTAQTARIDELERMLYDVLDRIEATAQVVATEHPTTADPDPVGDPSDNEDDPHANDGDHLPEGVNVEGGPGGWYTVTTAEGDPVRLQGRAAVEAYLADL